MRGVVFNNSKTDKEKMLQTQNVLSQMDNPKWKNQTQRKKIEEELKKLHNSSSTGMKDQLIIINYISGYRRIQNRVAGIINVLDFNWVTSNQEIREAINYFRTIANPTNSKRFPKDFLDKKKKSDLKQPKKIHGSFGKFFVYKN